MELKVFNHMHYWLYTPEKPGANKPLVIFLHGAGERGGNPENVFKISLPLWLRQGKWKPDAYVICPQCREGWDWNSQVERIKAIIDHEAARLQSDRRCISMTGLSMGGFGTWSVALHFPRFFSAIAPICGGGLSWRCDNLKDMPIRAFHGAKDDVVPPECSVTMVEAVNAAGGHAELTVFPECAHHCWDKAYGETDVLDWLIAQKREDYEDYPYFADAGADEPTVL